MVVLVVVEVVGKVVVVVLVDVLQQGSWCLSGHVATGRAEDAAWLQPAHLAHRMLHVCRCLSKWIEGGGGGDG